METEKTCESCHHNNKPYILPCTLCELYSNWTPKEEFVKEYMERCLPGESAYDVVNNPKHYMLFEELGIEVRDVISRLVEKIGRSYQRGENKVPEGFEAPLFEADYVQLMQYLMRFMDKNGLEDLKKARFYLDKLIESY